MKDDTEIFLAQPTLQNMIKWYFLSQCFFFRMLAVLILHSFLFLNIWTVITTWERVWSGFSLPFYMVLNSGLSSWTGCLTKTVESKFYSLTIKPYLGAEELELRPFPRALVQNKYNSCNQNLNLAFQFHLQCCCTTFT